MGSPHKLREYHDKYPNRPGPPLALNQWIEAWEKGIENMDHLEDDRVN
jgi:hypothetical protein